MVDPFFIFKNNNSRNLDIAIKEEWLPPVVKAKEEIEIIEVPGRDGFLTVKKGRKEPIVKKVKGVLVNKNNKVQIINWLQGNGKLTFSNERDVFYISTIINPVEFYEHWSGGYEFEVEFLCQPYGYLFNGQKKIIITEKETVLYNPTSEIAKPYIKICVSGSENILHQVDLIINNNIHKFDIDEYLVVDSELMESYRGSTLVPFTGKFPQLELEENYISWDGPVSQIDIIPRWRR